ncbi:MAG TPA: hypothetical protein VD995_04500 [Azospirillum sp.]|nr:hypothetical protein [Azospirillum sp.]
MTDNNVTSLDAHRFKSKAHTVRRPSVAEQLHGICDDLQPLAKGADEQSVLSIIHRIETIAERLGKPEGAA